MVLSVLIFFIELNDPVISCFIEKFHEILVNRMLEIV